MKIFKQYGMTLSPFLLIIASLVSGSQSIYYIPAVIINSFWFILEVQITHKQQFEDKVPKSPWIKISRIFWIIGVIFMAIDIKYSLLIINIPEYVIIITILLLISALVTRYLAFRQLGAFFSYDISFKQGHQLITRGIYRYIRHPSYLGICILGTLTPMILGSILSFILLSLFTIPQTIYRMHLEEEMLEENFHDQFREYKKKSCRLIPFIY